MCRACAVQGGAAISRVRGARCLQPRRDGPRLGDRHPLVAVLVRVELDGLDARRGLRGRPPAVVLRARLAALVARHALRVRLDGGGRERARHLGRREGEVAPLLEVARWLEVPQPSLLEAPQLACRGAEQRGGGAEGRLTRTGVPCPFACYAPLACHAPFVRHAPFACYAPLACHAPFACRAPSRPLTVDAALSEGHVHIEALARPAALLHEEGVPAAKLGCR